MTVTLAAYERHLRLEGCFNFRDLGGYQTTLGSRVRWRRLFRSDGPHALTDKDRSVLNGLHIATVLDLRTTTETVERGSYHDTIQVTNTFSLPMTDALPDVDELSSWIDADVVAARYRDMLEAGRSAIAEALTIMTDPSVYPVLFHCSAGKDRTGILAALLLGVLGVPDDVIATDYALSRRAMVHLVGHFEAAYPDARERLRRIAPAMTAAEPEAMTAFINGVRADYGSFQGFVGTLGVRSALPYLRASLLSG